MSDAEIITALEEEIQLIEYVDGFYSENTDIEVFKSSLDLIKRQKAKIEKLKKEIIDIDNFARDLCKERLLNGNKIATFEDLQSYINKQKSEVIREFAKKIKTRLQDVSRLNNDGTVYFLVGYELIEKIAKEMEGEKNNG